jgi:thiosulfate dehydrogenase
MPRRFNIAVILFTMALYSGAVFIGLRVRNFSFLDIGSGTHLKMRGWVPPHQSSVPEGARGASIRSGSLIFNETPLYASQYTGAKISCANCHAEGGIQVYASPLVGIPSLFPMYNRRAGHVISLRDRIEECFVRSENGKPLSYNGPEMQAIVDYIDWLSKPQPDRKPFVGRGLIALPDLKPDPKHGEEIYATQCAGCHGVSGEGRPPLFPPLWGPESFNDGAGMNRVPTMAAFVQHNMPQNRMGILSPQDAFDVSAYIHAQPRPAFNQAFKSF